MQYFIHQTAYKYGKSHKRNIEDKRVSSTVSMYLSRKKERTYFHGRRFDEMFLLFVWIHILQQGIWDIETRELSLTPVQEIP